MIGALYGVANGHDVRYRGRVPGDVIAAYVAASAPGESTGTATPRRAATPL